MARVIVFREIPVGGSTLTAEPSHEITRSFLMQTDVPIFGDKLLLMHRSLPKMFQRHPENNVAFVQSISTNRRNPRLWDVKVKYATNILEKEAEAINPLSRPADIEFDWVQETRFTDTDINGDAMLNTAGDPFPAEEIPSSHWVASVAKNVAQVPKWLLKYGDNPINSDEITLEGIRCPKQTLMLVGLRVPVPKVENDVRFFRLSLSLAYREKKWIRRKLNDGFREKVEHRLKVGDPTSFTLEEILINGQPASTAVLLDKNGSPFRRDKDGPIDPETQLVPRSLRKGAIRTDVKLSEIVTREFDVHEELPFGILPIK